jgi:UDP-2-acetamido-2,6-beta-L-arabino-hexul-4-ose reductase
MRILVTGSNGFIGKNLVNRLKTFKHIDLVYLNKNDDISSLLDMHNDIEMIFHFAGINRPEKADDYILNYSITSLIVDELIIRKLFIPIIYTSSIQVNLNNDYGNSKILSEQYLKKYSLAGGTSYIFRLPNVFGKWAKPNYNSVVATFSYNTINNFNINITNPNKKLKLVYIEDLIDQFISLIKDTKFKPKYTFKSIKNQYTISVKDLSNLIQDFNFLDAKNEIPNLEDAFVRKLYSTYISYFDVRKLNKDLKSNLDSRGNFIEILKSKDIGQISINIINPGKSKGFHWHDSKIEKFFIISGLSLIRIMDKNTHQVTEFRNTEGKFECITIPPGYVHSIENIGTQPVNLIIWSNEIFSADRPDTYYEDF